MHEPKDHNPNFKGKNQKSVVTATYHFHLRENIIKNLSRERKLSLYLLEGNARDNLFERAYVKKALPTIPKTASMLERQQPERDFRDLRRRVMKIGQMTKGIKDNLVRVSVHNEIESHFTKQPVLKKPSSWGDWLLFPRSFTEAAANSSYLSGKDAHYNESRVVSEGGSVFVVRACHSQVSQNVVRFVRLVIVCVL